MAIKRLEASVADIEIRELERALQAEGSAWRTKFAKHKIRKLPKPRPDKES